jgi:hypothetical protein
MIREWLDQAAAKKATHLIVVCDTFDYADYPEFVLPGEDVHAAIKKFNREAQMSRVMEVYNMAMPLAEQLAEHRAYHP